ncbi:MAG TPA: PEGA domain-containing protein [Candidatus Polarisedimenticolaceae bacterium]|nr:PEGA domain-containing protein [Candidatus Polarisedimenticolaceae bacterium]
MRTKRLSTIPLLALALALGSGAATAAPRGGGRSPHAGHAQVAPGHRSGGGPRAQARGRSGFRHFQGGHLHGHRGWSPSWWWGWNWGWYGWGWPYYGYYGYAPYYGYPPGYYGGPGSQNMPGAIETDVKPKKAEVRVDGELMGQARDFNGTWDNLWLDPGRHRVELSAPGYQSLTLDVEVRPGRRIRIDEELREGEGDDSRSTTEPAPEPDRGERERPAPGPAAAGRGRVRFDVQPGDAAVYLDGEFLGRADELARLHGAIPVAVGSHRVEVVRPGYRSEQIDVDVPAGEPARVKLELEPGS